MNKAQMRTQVADFVGDKNLTRYDSAQYDRVLDRAQEQFSLDSKVLWEDEAYTTTAADATYDLPSDFLYEDWVTYDGKELTPISQHDLQRLFGPDWSTEEGTPTHVLINPEEGAKNFRLFPIPQEAKSVVLRYFPLPASLASDSAIPLNSLALAAQFHIGICAYAGWLLQMSEDQTPAIAQKMAQLQRIYADSVTKAIDTFKNTASAGLKIRGSAKWR